MIEQVPEGWVRTKLDNVSLIQPGINVTKSKMGYGVPYVTVKDLYDGTSIKIDSLTRASIEESGIKKHSLRIGDIVLAKSSVKREGIGFPSMFSGKEKNIIPSGFTVRIRVIPKIVDAKFLLQSQRWEITRRWVINNSQQSAITNLNADIINNIPVLLPPLPEQQKIASILSSADETIEKTESQISKLQDLKKGMIQELLVKGIGHTEFKDSPVGRIPKEWEVRKVGEFLKQSKIKGYSGLPIYSVLMDGGMVNRNTVERRIPSELDDSANLFVKQGYLAYNMMRMWQGASGIAPVDCLVSPAYVVCEPSEYIDSIFLGYLIKTNSSIRKLHAHSQGITGDRLRLYFEHFSEIYFALPSIAEQKQIASIVSAIDNNIDEKQYKLQQTQSLKKSLMQDLLTGKVRVKVN